jgi:carbon monoxide dehydrogenase subunit G
MQLEGTKTIPAPRARVWELLNDPEVLKGCIPGCTELTGSAETGLSATVVQKVGPVKATFKGEVRLSNVVPGESYTISGEGKGGVAGFAKGAADVRLTDVEGGTELTYKADVQVGGKLAQLGNRIIGGFAKGMADTFFEGFVTAAGGGTASA